MRRSVDASRLNLVVIGAEGHGKSTLINAITGSTLSPIAEQYPGTVAPVYLEYGASDEAARYVTTLDGKDTPVTHRCADEQEFSTYLLQEMNPDNEKKVLAAVIQVNHPMLANGLRLVDMPGVEGVSSKVSTDAARFVDEQAHAVLVVCRGREYAPLARVARALTARERLEVDACVSNQSVQFFEEDEARLREKVAYQRTVMPQKINDEDGNLDLTPDRIFVLDLYTVSGLASARLRTEGAVHDDEESGLRRRLAEVVHTRGVDRVILDATGLAEQTVERLDAHLSTRRSMLESLRGGGPEADAIRESLSLACDGAVEKWRQLANPEVVGAVAEENFDELAPTLVEARDQILDVVAAKRSELERAAAATKEVTGLVDKATTMWETRLGKDEARQMHEAVKEVVQNRQGHVEDEQRRLLDELLERYVAAANDVLDTVYAEVPALRTNIGNYHLDVQGLLAFHAEQLDEDSEGRLIKTISATAAAGGGALLAGGGGVAILVGGALGPFTAAVAGALGAAVLGWALVDWLRGGKRAGVLKTFKKMQEATANLDVGPGGDLRAHWGEVVRQLVTSVEGYLMARLDALRALAAAAEVSAGAVGPEIDAIGRAQSASAALRSRLTEIGTAAQKPG